MKKIILFLNILIVINVNSQILSCPELTFEQNIEYNNETLARKNGQMTESILNNPTDKFVFNVQFHFVKKDDGTGILASYGEAECMNAILILNTTYNTHNIFFKYIGFDEIKSTLFTKIRADVGSSTLQINTHPIFDSLISYSQNGMVNPVYNPNAFNMYVVDGIDYHPTTSAIQVAGVAKFGSINSAYTASVFLSSTLPHELGHNFKLYHTWEGSSTSNCERVDGSNGLTSGDFVQDTPAAHATSNLNIDANCTYVNNQNFDCTNLAYVNVPIKNFMAFNNYCRVLGTNLLPGNANFTIGQITRARNYIALHYNDPNNTYGFYGAKNTIESLYKPYSSVPILSNIVSVTDDGTTNGMSIVCRHLMGYTYKFQKGFNYDFKINDDPTIVPMGLLTTPQYADYGNIKINQLNTSLFKNFGINCYRGAELCQSEPYVGGRIVTTNNLLGGQILIKNLNEDQINSPGLINNLENQTYNIITKETSSGATSTKVIFKQP